MTRPGYGRSLLLVTATGALVPLAGLATAPLLTQHLGVDGRGALGAALAPNTLIVGVATLGLPEAVAYLVARRPDLGRATVRRSLLVTAALGALAAVAGVLAGPVLAGGEAGLSGLIAIGAVLAVPALGVGVLRGSAMGQQRWDLVAWERGIGTVVRLVALLGLAVLGQLTVLTALLVSVVGPVVAGAAYLRPGGDRPAPDGAPELADGLSRTLLAYGGRVWLGSVATILVARISQLVVVPLSTVAQLGLYVVAVTVSDLPWILVQAVRDVVFGSAAADPDDERMLATSRVATTLAAVNALGLGLTLPWWIEPLFGPGFGAAAPATWLLLASSVVAVPGLIAGAAVAAAGRPGARSGAIAAGLAVDVAALVVLVPGHGATGAAAANLLCTSVTTAACLFAARRAIRTPVGRYLLPTAADLDLLRPLLRTLVRARPRRTPPATAPDQLIVTKDAVSP